VILFSERVSVNSPFRRRLVRLEAKMRKARRCPTKEMAKDVH
jgi:hypothetical protein